MEEVLKEKVKSIDSIIAKMKTHGEHSLVELLKEEIDKLKRLNEEYETQLSNKTVKNKETTATKTKYTLSDGSIYVINKGKNYKYLYDSNTSVITYEFSNGQIERTFPTGIKEIRRTDGKIIIKTSEKEYDVIN
ncbi:hypothetical protein NEDG_01140 [Nematocida displodere]|uniref:Centromere protein J C-terminal domain-containing protein n=1 Tax=Nematocida displodere TaxID=1805483 RepID=A0A177EBW8_9MICR|nr:hypothetical protein NEDG_01140 [Nematocida displodere]